MADDIGDPDPGQASAGACAPLPAAPSETAAPAPFGPAGAAASPGRWSAGAPDGGAPDGGATDGRARSDVFGLMQVGEATVAVGVSHLAEVTPVTRLSPTVLQSPSLFGMLDLRGRLVPLYDTAALCGMPSGDAPPAFAAVLRRGDRRVAVGVDAVLGIASLEPGAVQPLDPGSGSTPVTGGFLHDGAVVSTIDVPRLMASPGLQSARGLASGPAAAPRETTRPFLVFVAGGATFAVAATEVHSTVPRRAVERNSLTSGACLGTIMQHGCRVPVMDTTRAVGLGGALECAAPEIVVLRFPEDRLLGFAVDTICRLIPLMDSRPTAPHLALGPAGALLGGIVVDESDQQIFLLDPDALRTDPDLAEMAGMSGRVAGREGTGPGGKARGAPPRLSDVVEERVRHLVYEEGGRVMATPITQVVRIIKHPGQLVDATAAPQGVAGFFAQDGRTIPLVDLAQGRLAKPPEGARRVLLVGRKPWRIGVAVDAVLGIETSRWRAPKSAIGGDRPEDDGVVQLVSGQHRRILPRIDLEGLAISLSDPNGSGAPPPEKPRAEAPEASGIHRV